MSKVLERVVLKRLLSHVTLNNLSECFQSAYKACHSTETALLKICTDILNILDKNNVCLLTMLDLSAAFDTIDHNILTERLETTFGIRGMAIAWFISYLQSRTQAVKINGELSNEFYLEYGVPQGSVLGPVIFTMYTQPLSEIFTKFDVLYHFYADDSQLYKCDTPKNIPVLIACVEDCIGEVKCWMETNKLKLNDDKTEVMLCSRKGVGSENDKALVLDINGCSIQSSTSVKNLGVYLDQDMSMHSQINNLCRTLMTNLKKIASIRDF